MLTFCLCEKIIKGRNYRSSGSLLKRVLRIKNTLIEILIFDISPVVRIIFIGRFVLVKKNKVANEIAVLCSR